MNAQIDAITWEKLWNCYIEALNSNNKPLLVLYAKEIARLDRNFAIIVGVVDEDGAILL